MSLEIEFYIMKKYEIKKCLFWFIWLLLLDVNYFEEFLCYKKEFKWEFVKGLKFIVIICEIV